MDIKPDKPGLFERVFDREHFRSFATWPVDCLACYIVAVLVAPVKPYGLLLVLLPLYLVWMAIRALIDVPDRS